MGVKKIVHSKFITLSATGKDMIYQIISYYLIATVLQ